MLEESSSVFTLHLAKHPQMQLFGGILVRTKTPAYRIGKPYTGDGHSLQQRKVV
jgi:hypothetical protein